jgi:UDP-glucuronate decarboxylase
VNGGRILVTGAGGWLGSVLVEQLGERATPGVVALDRSGLDCADEVQVAEVLAEVRPTTVVHLAASLARGPGQHVVDAQWRDTFLAGRTVVQAAARAGVPHLVVLGTMEELGDHSGVLTQDLAPAPRTFYGLWKSLVREVAHFETRIAEGLRVDWARPTTVYGPGQRGNMLVPAACAAGHAGRVAQFTSGEQRRDFLHVDDLVAWLTLAVDDRVSVGGERGFHLHHLGTGEGVPVRDVLQQVADEFPGARFELGALPRRPHEPPLQVAPAYACPDPVLASWAPAVGWQDGLKRTIEWWRGRPEAVASAR